MTATHYLRLQPLDYRALALGQRHVLVLPLAEGVAVGDQVIMREWKPGSAKVPVGSAHRGVYTGAWLLRRVTDELAGDAAVLESHALYSLGSTTESERFIVAIKRKLGLVEREGVNPERFWRHQERQERARRERVRQNLALVQEARRAARAAAEERAP